MYTGNTWAPKTQQTRKGRAARLNYGFSGPQVSFHPTSFFKDQVSQLYCPFWLHTVPLIHKFKPTPEWGVWGEIMKMKKSCWVAAAERNIFTNNYFLVAEGSCLFLGSHLSVYLQLLTALNQFALDSTSASPARELRVQPPLPPLISGRGNVRSVRPWPTGNGTPPSIMKMDGNCCLHFLDNFSPFVMFSFVK